MEPILNLSPQEFRAALAELQLDPQREADLVRLYEEANAPQQGGRDRGMLRNLLDNIIGFDDEVVTPGERLGAGVEQFAGGLLSDPLGTGAGILQGGYETIERAMAPGATPMDVMGAAGMAMLGGGMVTGPRGALRSGLLRDAADETPAQRVARLLREGRASEVTDDLMAQVDPQEMYRLYEGGMTGQAMPMDEASRMARAGEMGFEIEPPDASQRGVGAIPATSTQSGAFRSTPYGDSTIFHATDADVNAFDNARLGSQTRANATGYEEGSFARNLAEYGHWASNRPLASDLYRDVDMPLVVRGGVSDAAGLDDLNATILDGSTDGRTYRLPDEEFGGFSTVVPDPTNIRSRFARFDPRLSHLANLNAANRSTATGLLASAASDTPAQRVARLLREGRADEVTDDLMAQADPQEMFRLYEAGETGMDLPMDFESRMARAIQQGFDVNDEMYRGDAPRSAFETGQGQRDQIGVTMSSRPDVAASYIPARGEGGIYPLLSRGNNDAVINAEGRNWNVIDRNATVDFQGDASTLRDYVPDSEFEAYDVLAGTDFLDTNDLSRMFQGYGADRVRFNDLVDRGASARYYGPESSMPSDVMMVANPANVRSRFARFDPRLSNLRNLSAANVDPLTGAAAVSASQQDDPLANLRAYIAAAGGVMPR